MLNGESFPRVMMTIIRFCVNTESHELKKLLTLYWEITPKYDESRKLLPEMILVCNALLKDLHHANEYVRGSMLRFLCKLREPELLDPLIPAIKECLEHRHSYVRKNAALAVFCIHKSFGERLIPDGPELIEAFIGRETDTAARRNAFMMLFNEAENMAIEYLANHVEEVPKFGDGFSLCVLELTRKVCRRDPAQKARFVRSLFTMLNSPSAAVSFEAAWTLVSLSSAPTAVRAAASTYTGLLNSQSDNNVKMIVLDRIAELQKHHSKVLQEVLMDLLRAISSPNIDICKKTLEVTMELVGPRNIEEVVQVLKREVVRTRGSDMEKGSSYRTMLIQSIHQCAVKFPDIADSVVHVLMDFLNTDGAMDVIVFVRAIVEQYPNLRESVLRKLLVNFGEMQTSAVLHVALWIIGEYCDEDLGLMTEAFEEIQTNMGEPPFAAEREEVKEEEEEQAVAVTKNVVLADGTYATQTTMTEVTKPEEKIVPVLRQHLIDGDVFLGSVTSCALTKLTLRVLAAKGAGNSAAKAMQQSTILAACGVARLAAVRSAKQQQTGAFADCLERISFCCRLLLDPTVAATLKDSFLTDSKKSFAKYLEATKAKEAEANGVDAAKQQPPRSQADDLINFRQLRRRGAQAAELDIYDGEDMSRATGSNVAEDFGSQLNHVYQLSGFADPVYAEACVTVHDYDIVLEILVINRTPNTLTNLTVELATMGDLKLVERPQTLTIGPLDQRTIRANIKVSSTETGHIFGTIVYENSSTAEKSYINLSDVHLDIMDYIHPHTCSDEAFRLMWAEFEWENKVAINTTITELPTFLDHIVDKTNMSCLTPTSALGGKSTFLAANLYAKSIFGEDALVNVSVEKKEDADGKLTGYIRIRSKTQVSICCE
jgi:coatomer subunit beta